MTDSIITALWRRRILVLTTFLITLGAVGVGTMLVPKSYVSTGYLRVQAADGSSNYEATQVSQVLLRTYAELLQTRQVIDAVARDPSVGLPSDDVARAVSIAPVEQSQLITVQATGPTPASARTLANTYATVGIGLTAGKANSGGASAVLAQPGVDATAPTWPRPTLNMLVGALLAAVLAVGVALLVDRWDPRVGLLRDGRLLGLPLLGCLSRGGTCEGTWRQAAAQLVLSGDRNRPASVAVVCVDPVDQMSDHCLLFGRMISEFGRASLVVDTDIARTGSRAVSAGGSGLVDYLSGRCTDLGRLLVPTGWPRLRTLPSGTADEALPLLMSPGLWMLESDLRRRGVVAVYQCPPLSTGSSGVAVAGIADVSVLVVNERRTRRAQAEAAVADIARAGGRLAGVVVIGASADVTTPTERYPMAAPAVPVRADGAPRLPA